MTTLDQTVADFLDGKRAQPGLSPKTLENYAAILTRTFLPWCQGAGITEPGQLDQPALDRFSVSLKGRSRPLAAASISSYLRHVKQFIAWTGKRGLTAPGVSPQLGKKPKGKLLDTLTRAEIARMEDATTDERDKLIIRVLGDSGIRLGELLSLTADSLKVQGRDHLLLVDGKTGQRLVPIMAAVGARLRKLAEKGRPADVTTDKIFITRRKRASGDYEALEPRGVQAMLIAIAAKAGITKRVNPHSFRHSMATTHIRRGVNLISLAKVLGHSDLTQLQSTYAHLITEDLSREMMRSLSLDGDGK